METLSKKEFEQKYGVIASSQFDSSAKEEGIFSEIQQAFQGGIGKFGQGINDAKAEPGKGLGDLVGGVGRILGGATEAITSPLAPALSRTVGAGINAISNKIGDVPGVQKFAQTPAGQKTAEVAGTVSDYANAAGLVAGGIGGVKGAPGVASKVSAKASSAIYSIPKPNVGSAGKYVGGALRDIVPTKQSLIDHNLAKALDLTPGDLSTIEKSTGNQVGQWLSDNNLIGTNKANTQGLISSFFKQNYEAVRGEIAQVKQAYKPNQIPRYTDALKAIQSKITGVTGLEKEAATIDNLLNLGKDITLADVQKVKELLDEHFSLYKATGDVAQGIEKGGLANVRTELKNFIENEVQKNTGADIRQLNNNVSTAKSLGDAIETRSPKGLTKANITTRDIMMGMGLTYFASPLVGLAGVLIKKIATSPTARLRFARYLDGLNDAQKAKISASLSQGEVPAEVQKVVGPLEEEPIPKAQGEIPKSMPTLEKSTAQKADTSGPFDGTTPRNFGTLRSGALDDKLTLDPADRTLALNGKEFNGKPVYLYEAIDGLKIVNKNALTSEIKGVYGLDKLLKNDELYAKYPALRNTDVVIADFHTLKKNGYQANGKIYLNYKAFKNDPVALQSTLVHEIQHLKQDLRGDLKKYSAFDEGRQMTREEYANQPREVDARRKQLQFAEQAGHSKEIERIKGLGAYSPSIPKEKD